MEKKTVNAYILAEIIDLRRTTVDKRYDRIQF